MNNSQPRFYRRINHEAVSDLFFSGINFLLW